MLCAVAQPLGVGDFLAWDGGCLLIGEQRIPTGIHSHYAVQLGFGEQDGIRFRESDESDWTSYDGVVIASRQPHAMDATSVNPSATLLIERETPAGRSLAEFVTLSEAKGLDSGIAPLPRSTIGAAGAALFDTWRKRDRAATTEQAKQTVATIAGVASQAPVTDERVLRGIAYVTQHLDGEITLSDVANAAFLSPPRFRHLFVEQTGTPFRAYVLWRRFIRAWDVIRGGAPISVAAHSAGFADAAHLTRTCQKMFGFPPSVLEVRSAT
jgi:AraC family transcriptional regulator